MNHDEKIEEQAMDVGAIMAEVFASKGAECTAQGLRGVTPEGQQLAQMIGFGPAGCQWGCERGRCTHGR